MVVSNKSPPALAKQKIARRHRSKQNVGTLDYKDIPEAYEIEERSRPDEMIMINIAQDWAIEYVNAIGSSAVLDMCCGTGLSLERLVDLPSISRLVGLDISEPYLNYARQRFASATNPPLFILGDAVTAPLPRTSWNLVVMASAYHHIEDDRKLIFLQRIERLIRAGGSAVIAENILPEYDRGARSAYTAAIRQFYREVLKEVENAKPPHLDEARALIKRVAQYGYDGDYEYKVCYSLFMDHMAKANLKIVRERRVWPPDNAIGQNGGNYVFLAKSREGFSVDNAQPL